MNNLTTVNENLNMKKIVLIGTYHKIQRNKDQSEFAVLLSDLIDRYCIEVIAEEIDVDSVASDMAKKKDIDYLVIEPAPEERIKLGIPSIASIEHDIFMEFDDSDSEEAQAELTIRKEKSFRTSEREWLRRISKLEADPILVICGSDHFQPFSVLSRDNNFEVIEESTSA
jgi:hypothetical protein